LLPLPRAAFNHDRDGPLPSGTAAATAANAGSSEKLLPVPAFLWAQARAAGRRFVVGYAIATGFALLQAGLRLDRRKAWSAARVAKLSRRILTDRQSFALGGFMAAFGLVYQTLPRRWAARGAPPFVPPSVAGAVAGMSIHALSGSFGTSLDPTEPSLRALVRAVGAAAGQPPLAATLPHIDAAVFIASCTVIMYAWFFHPASLSPEYRRWISKMAAMDTTLLELLRKLKDGRIAYGVHTTALDDYCDRIGAPRTAGDTGNGFVSCAIVHPADGTLCIGNSVRRAARGMKAALGLYLPVHIVTQILVHRGELFAPLRQLADDQPAAAGAPPPPLPPPTAPRASFITRLRALLALVASRSRLLAWYLGRAVVAALRSSAFLGTFIGLAWSGVCIARQARQNDLPSGPLLGSFLSGWSIFIEAPRRRAELAAYVAPRALHTTWQRLVAGGWVTSLPGSHVTIFSIAAALLMAAYENSRRRPSPALPSPPPSPPSPPPLPRVDVTAVAPDAALLLHRSHSAPAVIDRAYSPLSHAPAAAAAAGPPPPPPPMLVPGALPPRGSRAHTMVEDWQLHVLAPPQASGNVDPPAVAPPPPSSESDSDGAGRSTAAANPPRAPFSPSLAAIVELFSR